MRVMMNLEGSTRPESGMSDTEQGRRVSLFSVKI